MIRLRGTVSYVGTNGLPTLTSEYTMTPAEQEVVDLTNLIRQEGKSTTDLLAPLHALSVLIGQGIDPIFVEWLTGGTFTCTPHGIVGTQPAYDEVLDVLPGWWS